MGTPRSSLSRVSLDGLGPLACLVPLDPWACLGLMAARVRLDRLARGDLLGFPEAQGWTGLQA